MNAIELYGLQIKFYKGNEKKAFYSLDNKNRKIIEELIRNGEIPSCSNHKIRLDGGFRKKEYFKSVWDVTEKNAKTIRKKQKGKNGALHLDHIVPIFYGYKNRIPIELIASSENIRLISAEENLNKGAYLIKESIELLAKWGYYDKDKAIKYNNFINSIFNKD